MKNFYTTTSPRFHNKNVPGTDIVKQNLYHVQVKIPKTIKRDDYICVTVKLSTGIKLLKIPGFECFKRLVFDLPLSTYFDKPQFRSDGKLWKYEVDDFEDMPNIATLEFAS